jgi:hypothetical protein
VIVVGGIVFRVVTPNYPGDPKLDSAGAIRTEYLADESDPLGGEGKWTLARDDAFVFEDHRNADSAAKKIGARCHVSIVQPREDDRVPEVLTPQFTDVTERPTIVRKKKARSSRKDLQVDAFRAAQCRRDPVESL